MKFADERKKCLQSKVEVPSFLQDGLFSPILWMQLFDSHNWRDNMAIGINDKCIGIHLSAIYFLTTRCYLILDTGLLILAICHNIN